MTKAELMWAIEKKDADFQKICNELFCCGCAMATLQPRKNDVWDIVCIIAMPEKEGERKCEIVIGNRHTSFQPYVAWHCFDGNSYAWGHYVQTIDEAWECAKEKIMNELGIRREM